MMINLSPYSSNSESEDIPVWRMEDVPYGQATTQAGIEQTLVMDIYGSAVETWDKKPLIILAHGGHFLFGDKRDFSEECEFLAEQGYVAVTIAYRLIDVKNSDIASKLAVVDAVNDMRAAVRFFYKSVAEGNEFLIDTNNIFIGGYSAGAITALHYAYANTIDDADEMGGKLFLNYIEENGGLEGASGNAGFSSNVRGVINIAGSLHSANFVDPDEPLLYSAHGTEDKIVPYETGKTGKTRVKTEGSYLIHQRAEAIGLTNQFHSFPEGDHTSFFSCDECRQEVSDFIRTNLKNS